MGGNKILCTRKCQENRKSDEDNVKWLNEQLAKLKDLKNRDDQITYIEDEQNNKLEKLQSELELLKGELQQLNKETKESELTIPSVSTDNSRIDSLTLDEIEERVYRKNVDRVYEELKKNKAIRSTSRTRMAKNEKTPGGVKAPLKINSGQSVHEALNSRDSYSGALQSSKDALKMNQRGTLLIKMNLKDRIYNMVLMMMQCLRPTF
ncbi:hypothetical protein HHI36_002232 [Cryptolaemus montrouzieri]|uniref:Uncharacterized protein n=1 Tax=Cryptolaemus montrouzieri TaxID=559131 RepID=A0ABD2PAC3_9CUCU